jgi:hypothetical protein
MTTASDARAVLTSTLTHRLESTLSRTPVSDPAAIARITGPAVTQVMDAVDVFEAAVIAETRALRDAEHAVKSAAAETAQTGGTR